MTYESYRLLFFISAALSGLMLLLSLILFFALRIPRVIGDLSGANAKKAIAQIRAQNEGSGEKTYKSSAVNKERGRVTDKITSTGKLQRRGETGGGAMHTEKIHMDSFAYDTSQAETSVLEQENASSQENDIYGYGSETSILGVSKSGMYGQTSLLNESDTPYFEVEFDITYIHSDVLIS